MKKIVFTLALSLLAFFWVQAQVEAEQAPDTANLLESEESDTTIDNIVLYTYASVGGALVRHQISPTIDAFAILEKNKNIFFINNTSYYFFRQNAEGAYRTSINQFASLGYGVNLADAREDDQILSLGFGYLYHQNGGYFDGHTFKFSAGFSSGDLGYIADLIILDGFHSVIPSFRITVPFPF